MKTSPARVRPPCEPSAPAPASYRALLAVALLTSGGLVDSAAAADPGPAASGTQAAQPGSPSAASPGSQAASGAATPAGGTYTIRPLPLARQYTAADLALSDSGVQVAQNVSPTSNVPPNSNASPNSRISPSGQVGPQQATPPVGGVGGGGGTATYTIPPPPTQAQNPNALADSLKYRGWIVPLPGAADTLDQGAAGFRDKLAQLGISYFGFTDTTYQDNIIHHGHPPGVNNALSQNSKQEQYSGQLPTYTTADTIFVMYDLQRYGIPDGQLAVSGSLLETNWNPGDPDGIGIGQLSYYQTLLNKQIEIKAGYLTNNLEYLGVQVGGSLSAGLFGVSAAIPFETGQNLGSFPTPAINVKVNLPDHVYTKFGVQRSTSPDGLVAERRENPTSVRFLVPNAGVFVIDETGYRVNAAPGQMSTWIRAAANYDSSRYVGLTSGVRHNSNYGLYFLADRQLLQTAPNNPRTAYQGIYAGISAMFAPNYFNAFTQYYEARVYGFGVVPGRPFDFTSFVYNRNVFSGPLERELNRFGELTHDAANTYTLSYSAHVLPGTNVNLGVSYTDNPSPIVYNSNTGSSLSVLANLFVWF